MPVYDYECGKCAHKFEQRRSFSEGASATCPQCSNEAKRLFVPVPILFKGSGFYVTDYPKGKRPSEDKAPAPEKTGGEKSACPKTDCAGAKSGACDSSSCKN